MKKKVTVKLWVLIVVALVVILAEFFIVYGWAWGSGSDSTYKKAYLQGYIDGCELKEMPAWITEEEQ